MKKLILFAALTLTIISCSNKENKVENNNQNDSTNLVKEEIKESNTIDSTEIKKNDSINNMIIKKLKPFFIITKDEFDTNGLTWYSPKNRNKYVDENGIYCYFQVVDKKASNFRLKFQYYADDWLFIQKVQFSIDGKTYEFIPNDVKSDNDTNIWEWFDENIDEYNEPLIKAIANAKVVKMKIIGSQYHDIKTMSKVQIESIKKTYELYKAMGGDFN